MRATAHGSFAVSRGNKLVFPDDPNPETWDKIVSGLSGIIADIEEIQQLLWGEEGGDSEASSRPIIERLEEANINFANALKREKSGASVVLTDISPITHPLKVSVEGVEDLSSVKVLVPGKNLFDINSSDGFLTKSGRLSNEIIGNEIKVRYAWGARDGYLKLGTFDAGTYYISITGNLNRTFHAFLGDKLEELTYAQIELPGAITITKPTTIWACWAFSNTAESYIISNVQVELGNTATEYEPYNAIEYPVNADGTVDGIKSIYPSMVLMTNTTGATINCEYNRDAARYADKVDEAIVRGLAKQETLDAVIEDIEALKNKGVELAPTLDGNETDKAPSVQAVNEGLDSVKARGNGLKIELDHNEDLHKFRLRLVNADGENQSSTEEIDLPLESTIIDIAVSEDGENLILTLNNGAQSTIPAEAIVRGLVKQEDFDELKEKFENQEVPKIELAPTLDGNETDKAPSVKAVNEGLNGIETALDSIIEIQNSLIGGDGE